MRYFYIFSCLLLLSCVNKSNDSATTNRSDRGADIEISSSPISDIPNTPMANSEYEGTYLGHHKPSENSQIEITIALTRNSYVKTIRYTTSDNTPVVHKGNIEWDAKQKIVTLDKVLGANRYKLIQHQLIQLDLDGNETDIALDRLAIEQQTVISAH